MRQPSLLELRDVRPEVAHQGIGDLCGFRYPNPVDERGCQDRCLVGRTEHGDRRRSRRNAADDAHRQGFVVDGASRRRRGSTADPLEGQAAPGPQQDVGVALVPTEHFDEETTAIRGGGGERRGAVAADVRVARRRSRDRRNRALRVPTRCSPGVGGHRRPRVPVIPPQPRRQAASGCAPEPPPTRGSGRT